MNIAVRFANMLLDIPLVRRLKAVEDKIYAFIYATGAVHCPVCESLVYKSDMDCIYKEILFDGCEECYQAYLES